MRIRKQTSRWFECVDDPDEGRISIRHIEPGERQDIIDKTMPQRIDYEENDDGDMIPVFSTKQDRKLDRELTMMACVEAWENFFDESGNQLECTHENILRAVSSIEGLFEFVAKCREILTAEIKKEQEVQEKNS